ncbi:MAG: polyphenol oxidase family protein [Bdellovibrionales bacterium]|nr:polyphenol oxidase family protein [Bdellovibrionales bacterium]
MLALESALLLSIPGVHHSFGTAEEPLSGKFLTQWQATKPDWKQVHGTGCAQVVTPGQYCGEVDSLWTDVPGQWIGVITADCVPILIADRDGRAVAAVHAGWRGTLARAVKPVLAALNRAGYDSSKLVAAIGPCIRACCFEVGKEVSDQFFQEFPQISEELLSPKPSYLDLVAVNETILRGMGIERIDSLSVCTKCSQDDYGNPLLNSYRREGRSGKRQFSIISIKSR